MSTSTTFCAKPPSGKKVGRREDLPNIEVSGFWRIRQSDPGVGFSLLVQEILQDGFGIDPDEFFPQDAIQQVHVPGVDAVAVVHHWKSRIPSPCRRLIVRIM